MPEEYHLIVGWDLLGEFVFKQKTEFLIGKQEWPVQGSLLSYGIRITNIDTGTFKGGRIFDFHLESKTSDYIIIPSRSGQKIPSLKPGETVTIWIDDCNFLFDGPWTVSCIMKHDESYAVIKPYIIESNGKYKACFREVETFVMNGEPFIFPQYKNKIWICYIFVMPKIELLQAKTNILVLILSGLTLVFGLINLKELGPFMFDFFSSGIQFLATIIKLLYRLIFSS